MSIKTEVLQLKVVVDTKEGINNLAYLEELYRKVGDARKSANSVESDRELSKAQDKVREKIAQQRDELGLYGKTVRQIQSYIRDLGADMRDLIPGSEQAKEFRSEIEKMREISSGKADAREQKFREIDELRLMIKDSGAASLSLKQLEKVGTHLFETMSSSAQSGAIETHQFYEEWQNINKQIKLGKDVLDKQKVAENAYNIALKETIRTQGIEKTSLTHLREYHKLLQQEIADTADFEEEANKKRIADSKKTEELISKKEGEMSGTSSFFGQIKKQLPAAVSGAMAGLFVGLASQLVEPIVGAFSKGVDLIKKRARDITDIQVALDTSRGNAEEIKGQLNDIRTETSVDELKKLVEVAGDLNVASGDVKAFVAQADQFAVVMGDDFGTNIQESVGLVAKLKAEFKDTKDLNFQDSLGKIGSMLKDLNLDGAATVPGMTDFLKRVGALPEKLKPAITELAGFGAVFEEANLTSEIAGSGFTRILLTASNNAELFGKQMRMSKQEVENLINTNPNEFVIKFTESLKGLSGTDTAKTLKAVKLESDEVTKVVGVLTDNVDKLRQKQELANQSFTDGTTITSTFNKYLNDEAGQIAQIEKAWNRVTNSFVNWLTKVSGPVILGLAGIVEKGKTASEVFEEQDKKTTSMNAMLPKLIDKYELLSLKTEKTADDQERLNSAMQSIGSIVPGAVTQYDNLGRVMKVNLGIVNDYLDKMNIANKHTRNAAIMEKVNENNKLLGDRAENLQALRTGKTKQLKETKYGLYTQRVYEEKVLTDDEIRNLQRETDQINKTIIENRKKLSTYKQEVDFTPVPPTTKTDTKKPGIGTGTGKGKGKGKGKGNNDADAEAKYLQESAKQMLELQAKLDFEELQATADAEQKRINIANKTAEDEIKRIETQFKNQKGIVLKESQLSQEQKDIIHRERLQIERKQEEEVVAIYEEFDKKREAQILEQTNRAIQLAQDAKSKQLQATLKTAQRKGTSQEIFNAQEAIIFNNQEVSLANLKIKYDKEKEALKDNKDALAQLEKNYGTEKSNIISQNLTDWELLIGEFYRNDVEKAKKANIEKLRLDVSEAELNGDNPNAAKIALLNAEMQAELSVANLTEAEKTNILRRYAQERQGIEKNSMQSIAQQAIEIYSQAFSAVTGAFQTDLNNRSQTEQVKHEQTIANLENQKERGIMTSRQLTKAKAIEDKAFAKEQNKLKREQFELDKINNISTATINGIQAVMKGYAQAGPLGGLPLAILMGSITLGNIATIAAQKAPAYFDGGALPSSFPNPVDSKGGGIMIGHPDEYMIPAVIRKSPAWANLEPAIEHARITKQIPPSFYDGGPIFSKSITRNQSSSNNSDDFLEKLDQRFEQLVDKFAEKMATPITAHTAIGEQEIFKLEQERQNFNKKMDDSLATTSKSLIQ